MSESGGGRPNGPVSGENSARNRSFRDEVTGGFDKSSLEAPQTHVPVHGVRLDVIGRAPVGANFYLIAEWSKTHARVGDTVLIRAVLSRGINGAVRVQIFHEVDNRQIWVESVNGFINKGVVSARWTTKNKAKDYDRGCYFFTIIGGRANATSSNRLTLR